MSPDEETRELTLLDLDDEEAYLAALDHEEWQDRENERYWEEP